MKRTVHKNKSNLLYQHDISFALYCLPGENLPRWVESPPSQVKTFQCLSEVDGEKGFIMVPFNINSDTPIVLISGQSYCRNWSEVDDFLLKFFQPITESQLTSAKYQRQNLSDDIENYRFTFDDFKRELDKGEVVKLVLSRAIDIGVKAPFSLVGLFKQARQQYPNAYIYLCHSEQTGTWFGCSPEILLSGRKNQWQTVALAGTQEANMREQRVTWDDKNKQEQQVVAQYIRDILQTHKITFTEHGPFTCQAGALCHLKTHFQFSLANKKLIAQLLSELHPTPAVCGLPKQTTYDFICHHEGYKRDYYSGFMGYLDADDQTDLYVNLRCLRFSESSSQVRLFAGGGLLSASTLINEWQETEAKLNTLRFLIQQQTEKSCTQQKAMSNM